MRRRRPDGDVPAVVGMPALPRGLAGVFSLGFGRIANELTGMKLALGESDKDGLALGEADAMSREQWGLGLEGLQARVAEFRQSVR